MRVFSFLKVPMVLFYPEGEGGAGGGAGAGAGAGAGSGAGSGAGAGAGGGAPAGGSGAGSGGGAGAGSGTGGSGGQGAGAGSGAGGGQGAGGGAGAGAGAGAGGAAARKKFEFDEDRSQYVPPDRFAAAEDENKRLRQMLKVAGYDVGGERRPPMDPAVKEAREAILQLFPEIRQMLEFQEENGSSIVELLQNAPNLDASAKHIWTRHGAQALGALHTSVAKELGADKLDERQTKRINGSFLSWLEESQDNMQAYLTQPADAVAELFLSDWRAGFFDPLRRTAQAGGNRTASGNARLPGAPSGGGAGAGGGGNQKPTEDQIHDSAFKHMQQVIAGNRR